MTTSLHAEHERGCLTDQREWQRRMVGQDGVVHRLAGVTLVNGSGGRRAARAATSVDGLSHGGGRRGGSPSGMADAYRLYENNTRT